MWRVRRAKSSTRAARRALPAAAIAAALALSGAGAGAGEAGSLDRLVGQLDRRLAASLGGSARRRRTDLAFTVRAGKATTLGQVLRRLLLARCVRHRLASCRAVAARPRAALARWARRRGYELLLDVTAVQVEGHLHLRGELSEVDAQLWRDTVQPRRGTRNHLHAAVRIDAEVRSYLGKVTARRVAFAPRRLRGRHRPVLAMDSGDLDGDGRVELVVVHRRRLEVLQYDARRGRYARRAQLALPGAAAGIRPRRAVATLLVRDLDGDGKAEVYVRSAELAEGGIFALDGKGKLKRRAVIKGFPLIARRGRGRARRVDGARVVGRDIFRADRLVFTPRWRGRRPALPRRFYSLRAARIAKRGGPRGYAAAVDTAGKLVLLDGALRRRLATLQGAGVAVDLVDVDDDGGLELITTTDSDLQQEDRVRIFRLRKRRLRPVWRSPLLGGRVTALAHGDVDGDGKQELVAAVEERSGRCALVHLN